MSVEQLESVIEVNPNGIVDRRDAEGLKTNDRG